MVSLKLPNKISWKTSIIWNFQNPNTFCWPTQPKIFIIRNFCGMKKNKNKKNLSYRNSFIFCNSFFNMFTYFFVPLQSYCKGLITAVVGITSEEVKNPLCKLPRVSFLQMTNDCLIFFNTNCELVSVIVLFCSYDELLLQLWSPYYLVNMMLLG